eukprot:240227-Prorocentrum_minimum.AAC.5
MEDCLRRAHNHAAAGHSSGLPAERRPECRPAIEVAKACHLIRICLLASLSGKVRPNQQVATHRGFTATIKESLQPGMACTAIEKEKR